MYIHTLKYMNTLKYTENTGKQTQTTTEKSPKITLNSPLTERATVLLQ